jgi:hypothetical protein
MVHHDLTHQVVGSDAAGVVVRVGAVPSGGFLDVEQASHGSTHGLIRVEAGGSRMPTTHETVDNGDHFFRMDGRGVRDFVMENVPGAVKLRLPAVDAGRTGARTAGNARVEPPGGARTHAEINSYTTPLDVTGPYGACVYADERNRFPVHTGFSTLATNHEPRAATTRGARLDE